MSSENAKKPSRSASARGTVVKGVSGYRTTQGADYEPGVSAETVGPK